VIDQAHGEGTLEWRQGSALLSDAIHYEGVSEPISGLNAVRDILLGRAVKVRDTLQKPVSHKTIIETLWFQHIKTLLLVTLEDVEGNIFMFSPALDLRYEGKKVSTLYPWLCGQLTLRDDRVLYNVGCEEVIQPGKNQIEDQVIAGYPMIVVKVDRWTTFVNSGDIGSFDAVRDVGMHDDVVD